MGERFLVLFNSQGTNVISNSNLNKVIYNVNWGSFLPVKYKRFRCQFVFKSVNVVATATANGLISMDLGKMNVYDGNTQTTNLGIVYPVLNGSTSYYSSTNNDNNDFYINYPTNQQVSIILNSFSGSNLLATTGSPNPSTSYHYVLYLSLEGVEENNDL
jgi:hypothetical protein